MKQSSLSPSPSSSITENLSARFSKPAKTLFEILFSDQNALTSLVNGLHIPFILGEPIELKPLQEPFLAECPAFLIGNSVIVIIGSNATQESRNILDVNTRHAIVYLNRMHQPAKALYSTGSARKGILLLDPFHYHVYSTHFEDCDSALQIPTLHDPDPSEIPALQQYIEMCSGYMNETSEKISTEEAVQWNSGYAENSGLPVPINPDDPHLIRAELYMKKILASMKDTFYDMEEEQKIRLIHSMMGAGCKPDEIADTLEYPKEYVKKTFRSLKLQKNH